MPIGPAAVRKLRRIYKRARHIEVRNPFGGGHFRHAAKEAFGGAVAHQHITVSADRYESGTATQAAFAFFLFAGERFGIATRVRRARADEWALPAGRCLR